MRSQLGRLDGLLAGECDLQRLDRLARALSRLSELERQLSNRPLPGSLNHNPVRDAQVLRPGFGWGEPIGLAPMTDGPSSSA